MITLSAFLAAILVTVLAQQSQITISNPNSASITTIVGCDHARNTQSGRSGSKKTCAELQTLARNLASGKATCTYRPSVAQLTISSSTKPYRCKTSGATETYTGKRKRSLEELLLSKRQFPYPPPPPRFGGPSFNQTAGLGAGAMGPPPPFQGPTTAGQGAGSVAGGQWPPAGQGSFGGAGGSSTSSCGTYGLNVNSIYIEEIIGDYRVIASNGIPDHNYEYNNPGTPCEIYRVMIVPKNPAKPTGSGQGLGMGGVGITKTGAHIYNQLSAEAICDAAYTSEKSTFGKCEGHGDPSGQFHYHGPSSCLKNSSKALSGEECPIIGYMLDGYPVRSECSNRKSCYEMTAEAKASLSCKVYSTRPEPVSVFPGCDSADFKHVPSTTCQLDAANGFNENSGYTYYLSSDYPYSVTKMMGTQGYMCVV